MPVGRVTQVVDCRAAMGMGKGGGIAQRGTISECRYPDVIVVGMSPGRRHVTKPVCDITSALRQQGIEYSISTLVLNAGSGVPPDARDIGGGVLGAYFGLTTFSTFSWESWSLIREARGRGALAYAALTIGLVLLLERSGRRLLERPATWAAVS